MAVFLHVSGVHYGTEIVRVWYHNSCCCSCFWCSCGKMGECICLWDCGVHGSNPFGTQDMATVNEERGELSSNRSGTQVAPTLH